MHEQLLSVRLRSVIFESTDILPTTACEYSSSSLYYFWNRETCLKRRATKKAEDTASLSDNKHNLPKHYGANCSCTV
jgi:hypothetical protein